MRSRRTVGLSGGRLVVLALCLGVSGGARPPASEAAGRCVPKVEYSMGYVTCYRPAQVAQAEQRLRWPPLSPVAAVWRVTRLPLDQVDAMQPLSLTTSARGPVIALDYLFGPPAPATLYSMDPPPAHPAFVVVHEALGHRADLGDVHLERGSYSGSNGSGYLAWELDANIPGRPLSLHLTSNQGAATLIRIAAAMVGRAIHCSAVSGGGVQIRNCA